MVCVHHRVAATFTRPSRIFALVVQGSSGQPIDAYSLLHSESELTLAQVADQSAVISR